MFGTVGLSFALAGSTPLLSFFSPTLFQKPQQVIGVGGGGSNAVNRMLASDLAGVDLYVLNTDSQVREKTFFFDLFLSHLDLCRAFADELRK